MAKYQGKYSKKKPAGKGGIWFVLLILLFMGAVVFGVWKLCAQQKEYDIGTETYDRLAGMVMEQTGQETSEKQGPLAFVTELIRPNRQTVQEDDPAQSEQETPAVPFRPVTEVDFSALQAVNPETVGWISGLGGAVNYPVVQGTDNDYYLDHLFDGTANRNGTIFIDCRNAWDLTDPNTFIYGHNMQNGAMFAAITNYANQSWYDCYPELVLVMPGQTWSLQAFSGYVTSGDSDSYRMTFADGEDFAAYLEMIRSRSDFTSSVPVTAEDRIVTLSTCTYDYEDARYLLHCRLVPMQ